MLRSASTLVLILTLALAASGNAWICGDVNDDGTPADIGDLVYLVSYMFQQGPEPPYMESCDVNGDGTAADIGDLVYLVSYMFQQGPDLTCPSETPEETVGYTLVAPSSSTTSYLIDSAGNVVNTWSSSYRPGLASYLLDDSTLLRTAASGGNSTFGQTGGAGGRVERYDWDGDLIWEFDYNTSSYMQHHDIEYLPNGNVLVISWESKSQAEALQAGRNPSLMMSNQLWPDKIIEVEPTGSSGGTIVWEWHVWDHLIQDYDATKDNYGVVSDHPEKINLNFVLQQGAADWNHCNGIDYNADLDQIMLTSRKFSEIWIIDHNTTTEEAAGEAGDLLYRWGNPATYDRGDANNRTLYVPHHGCWIEEGCPDFGDITIFNNGSGRSDGNYSTVDQFTPPEDGSGGYTLVAGEAYGPSAANWSYVADPPTSFYASHVSGAQRLPDGNTLITNGESGLIFEVTTDSDVVWEFDNPYGGGGGGGGTGLFRAMRVYLTE